jgi:drug/metabolite transporter (DMT)-like permease
MPSPHSTAGMHPAQPQGSTAGTARAGVMMGVACVGLWSCTAALISLSGQRLGTWLFLAVASTLGGAGQMLYYRAAKGSFAPCLRLPWRLWVLMVLGFVLYGLVYPLALTTCVSDAQLCGVNLINYLWPVLTIVCALLWVPGTLFSWRLGGALALAIAGLALANQGALRNWLHAPPHSLLPYGLAAVAAVCWAVYSSLLARWRAWARDHATAPLGFLLTGLVAAIVCLVQRQGLPRDPLAWGTTVLCAVGPFGAGYLLWELALHRAPASTLGLLGAVIPVLSTILLCAVRGYRPGAHLWVAAILVSAAAMLSVIRPRARARP